MKKRFLFVLLGVAGVLIFGLSPVLAQDPEPIDEDTVVEEIEKFLSVADGLANVVTVFTTILITPMGISAGAKVFKTLVLYNL